MSDSPAVDGKSSVALTAHSGHYREPGAPEPVVDDIDEDHNDGDADVPNPVGQVLDGKYRIDAHIGRGGMASVYRALHLTLRRHVALKILHPRFAAKAAAAARFEREAQSASRLRHPNCLQVTDFGTTRDGTKYLIMELLEGRDLSSMLSGAVPPDRAVDLMVQIFRGLQHAHENGVIHRDLKPHNVFMTRDHEGREILKIVDFGLAKLVAADAADPAFTQHGAVFGTPLYMSPEQAVGMSDVDCRSDLYSAGVIFYSLLAGHPPFQAPRALALLHQHVAVPPPPLPGHIPAEVRRVVERLLVKHRDGRYPDAQAVLEALRPHGPGQRRDDSPVRPTAVPVADRARTPSQKHLASALDRASDDPRLVRVDGTESSSHHATPVVKIDVRAPAMEQRLELAWNPRTQAVAPPQTRFSWPSLSPLFAAAAVAVLWALRGTWLGSVRLDIPLGAGVHLHEAHVTSALWVTVGLLGVWSLFRASR